MSVVLINFQKCAAWDLISPYNETRLFIQLPFVHAILNDRHLVDVPFVDIGANSKDSGESAQKCRLVCVFASLTSDTSVYGIPLCIGFDISVSFLCGSRAQNTILCATVDTFVSGKLFRYSILIFELYASVSCAWKGALRKLNQHLSLRIKKT